MGLQRPEPVTPTEQLIDYLIEQVMAGNSNAATMLSAFQSGVHPLQVIDSNGDIFSMVVIVDPNTLVVSIAYYDADGNVQTPAAPATYYYAPLSLGVHKKVQVNVTTQNGVAYNIDDCIGGLLTFLVALRQDGGTCTLRDVSFWSQENKKPNLIVDLWKTAPSGTYTDGDAIVIDSSNQNDWLGSFEVAVADWKDVGTVSRCTIKNLGLILEGFIFDDIFMTIQIKTATTYTSTNGLSVKVGVDQN